jgi:S-adenosylhomocysteine hydrolase
MSTRIDWVAEHCRLLRSISAEFKDTQPFRGLTVGTGIHLEARVRAYAEGIVTGYSTHRQKGCPAGSRNTRKVVPG